MKISNKSGSWYPLVSCQTDLGMGLKGPFPGWRGGGPAPNAGVASRVGQAFPAGAEASHSCRLPVSGSQALQDGFLEQCTWDTISFPRNCWKACSASAHGLCQARGLFHLKEPTAGRIPGTRSGGSALLLSRECAGKPWCPSLPVRSLSSEARGWGVAEPGVLSGYSLQSPWDPCAVTHPYCDGYHPSSLIPGGQAHPGIGIH